MMKHNGHIKYLRHAFIKKIIGTKHTRSHTNIKMNSIRLLLLLSVSVAQAHSKDKTQGTRVGDFVNKQSCDGNFDVQLTTVSGDTLKASCPGSYSRCPFAKTSNDWNDPDKCLGSPGDWTSECGRSLGKLFLVSLVPQYSFHLTIDSF